VPTVFILTIKPINLMQQVKDKIFSYKNITIIQDNLKNFLDILCDSKNNRYNIYFDFKDIENSLKKVKQIILKNKATIDFKNLYFYNANDFINFILEKPIYLPKNINLFINKSCIIGCNFCGNKNALKWSLSLKNIKFFLEKYSIGDNMNFNILWQWDPIFNPELLDILNYIKSIGWYITFFSWWKSLLFVDNFMELNSLVDEFKINLSSSNENIYNLLHTNKITKNDFEKLKNKLKIIANRMTLITVLTKDNITDIYSYYKLCKDIWAMWLEIKKNLQYLENDILLNKKTEENILELIHIFQKDKNINIISNIWTWLIKFNKINDFSTRSQTILDKYVEWLLKHENLENMNTINKCFQFWQSLDITENNEVAICCDYDISIISDILYKWPYYEDSLYKNKYSVYTENTPNNCKRCPMPIDRYKNYLKYNFIKNL
jgi:MoaA/NifB/PqqE/SkfB family radical SAM enzyme